MSLNIFENAWINCSDYARVFNILRYNCNNVNIVVINVIIIEFFSAQFEYPGALLLFYLFLTEVRTYD